MQWKVMPGDAVGSPQAEADQENEEATSSQRSRSEFVETGGSWIVVPLELKKTPEADDYVIEAEGARGFLNTTAAKQLAGKNLDAEVDENGGVRLLASAAA